MTVEVEIKRQEKIADIAAEKMAELEKADNDLVEKKDEELSPGQLIRKQELMAAKTESKGAEKTEGEDQDKTKEIQEIQIEGTEVRKKDKVVGRKEEIQSEIDKLVREKKTLEEEVGSVKDVKLLVDRINILESKLHAKEESEDKKNLPEQLKKAEEERIAAYLKKDEKKPREERREMSDSEIDDWFLEDPRSATRWVARQEHRRIAESQAEKDKLKSSKPSYDSQKQKVSTEKLFARFPKVNVSERVKALKAGGKNDIEIHNILSQESSEYKLMVEIAVSDPDKYQFSENGPELVMAEMEKRLGVTGGGKKTYTEEEVNKIRADAVRAEQDRQSAIDVGNGSTRGGSTHVDNNGRSKDPNYQKGLRMYLYAGKKHGQNWTEGDYKESLKYRESIEGVDTPDVNEKGKIV